MARSDTSASKTPTMTASSGNSSHLFMIRLILMLQKGHEENRKKVRMTLLPFMEDSSKVEPSMAGSEISGAGSPFLSLVMAPGRKCGVKNAP